MKRTDMDRIERELKRVQKRQRLGDKRDADRPPQSVGNYVKDLKGLLRHDDQVIYNTLDDEDILELFENMQEDLPEEKWEMVIRKAVNATKVPERDKAVEELCSLIDFDTDDDDDDDDDSDDETETETETEDEAKEA